MGMSPNGPPLTAMETPLGKMIQAMTRNPLSPLLATLGLTVLAACGGGGGGAPVTQTPVIPGPSVPDKEVPQTNDGLRGAATDLLGDWTQGGVADYTSLAVVPASGSAAYAGYLYGDLSISGGDTTDSLVGRLTLAVDFAPQTATFSGTATDFVDARDASLTGTLDVSGGSFNRDGNPASDATLRGIAVAGTLREGDGTTWDVGMRLEGDFLGDSAEAIGGEAIGRITVGGAAQDFDGGFIAQE